jgi:hypothetical protein
MMRVAMGSARPVTDSGAKNVLSNIQFSSWPPVATSMVAQEAAVVTIPDIAESARRDDSEIGSRTGASQV